MKTQAKTVAMFPLFETPISTSNLYAPDLDRVCAFIDQAADDDGNVVAGTLVTALEKKLCEYHQARYCVTFSTGFWALVAAVRIRSLPEKSQVIIPSLTYRRLADVVYWSGKAPRFVDVEPNHLGVCPDAVEHAISDETSLILAVHPIVNCCDVHGLLSISDQRGVPIVFDAVESVHETIGAQRVGSFGVGEVFSLHASKLINGMEGGYVCTDERDFAQRLIEFRDGGISGHEIGGHNETDCLGLNGALNDGHAALALAGLEEITSNVQHNKTVYQRYLSELKAISGIEIVRFCDVQQTSYKNVVAAVTDDFPIDRNELVRLLNAEGILARAHYTPALHNKTYDYPVETMQMRVTPQVAERFINLPCGQRTSPEDVARVCQYLKSIIATHDGKMH